MTFNKDQFDRKLKILLFDLNKNQNEEFKEFFNLHLKNGTDKGSYFFDLRSNMKEKHFREYLNIIIKTAIDSYSDSTIIYDSETKKLKNMLLTRAKNFIDNERSSLQSVFASRGYKTSDSIVSDTVKAYISKLNYTASISKDLLHNSIIEHNKSVQIVSTTKENQMIKTNANMLMALDQEQTEVFINFVETFKDIIRDKRNKFLARHLMNNETIIEHPLKGDLRFKIYTIDFEALWKSGLFEGNYINSPSSLFFIVNIEGLKIYEGMKKENSEPIQRIEKSIFSYLKSSHFIERFPKAYKKWLNAETLFLDEASNLHLTTIGHLCRESLQEFSDELLQNKAIENKFDKAKIIAKIKAVVEQKTNSDTLNDFLMALLNYWGTLSDLVQKQEHDSQKEGRPLSIDDARRIIFHTAIVMFEIDKSIT